MAKQLNEDPLTGLKKSIDTLVLIELANAGATYDQIRKIIGSVDNNTIASIKSAVGDSKKVLRGDGFEKKGKK